MSGRRAQRPGPARSCCALKFKLSESASLGRGSPSHESVSSGRTVTAPGRGLAKQVSVANGLDVRAAGELTREDRDMHFGVPSH